MGDSFFVNPSNSRKRARTDRGQPKRNAERSGNRSNGGSKPAADADEDITSESEAEMPVDLEDDNDDVSSESDHETETEKRRRLAKEYLATLETELVEGFDAKDLDEDIIARRLKTDVAEQQGRIFRDLRSSAVSDVRKTRTPRQKHLTALTSAGRYVYVASKDGILSKWSLNISSGKPSLIKQRKIAGRICRGAILCVAVNTANKLVVTGHSSGFAVHNAESLDLLREFKVTGDTLSCVFRRNSNELYVGGSDLRLRTYDLTQWAFVETLHGHQDQIMDLDALNQERCVSVGARDRTVIYWKIPEESRLTFRGGDTKLAAKYANIPLTDTALQEEAHNTILEGSIDCCAMLDHQLFVTGSDNGNVCLWSISRKKPQFLERLGHGLEAPLTPSQASGEKDPSRVEIPPQLPHPVTAMAAIPFSNTFFTGSNSGVIRMWSLSEDTRSFALVKDIEIGKGIVTSLTVSELSTEEGKPQFAVVASVSREPRLGRWLIESGRDQVVAFKVVDTLA